MVCRLTGCSLVKKGILGAALGAGALWLAFGTEAPSYVKTAFNKVRNNAKNTVPVQFEIDRAREELANLEPAIKDGIAEYLQAQIEIEKLSKEIDRMKSNLETEKTTMRSLRETLGSGDVRLAGSSDMAEKVKIELASRLDAFRSNNRLLQNMEATLEIKTKSQLALKGELDQVAITKNALKAELDAHEARLKTIETTQASREPRAKSGALAHIARLKQNVSTIGERVEMNARVVEMEGKYLGTTTLPATVQPGRDVVKELDSELGAPAKKSSTDKSL